MDIYANTPAYQTRDFTLRPVELSDAEALLECYSDPEAVAHMNADNCTSDFNYTTTAEMRAAIEIWQAEQARKRYIRFAIISKTEDRAIGTLEMFGGDFGVLRIDIATRFETPDSIAQLTTLAISELKRDFGARRLLARAGNTPDRAPVYAFYGFAPADDFRPGVGYWEYAPRGLAYCGLACDLCSENEGCPGCREKGCPTYESCANFNCCSGKGLNGCWECAEFPCGKGLLANPRMRAFCECAAELGEAETVRRLMKNRANGVVYHEPGALTGDYDDCEDIEGIKNLVKYGK